MRLAGSTVAGQILVNSFGLDGRCGARLIVERFEMQIVKRGPQLRDARTERSAKSLAASGDRGICCGRPTLHDGLRCCDTWGCYREHQATAEPTAAATRR